MFGIFAFICIFYSELSLFGYGGERSMMPLVTESMPRKSPIVWTIKTLYCAVVIIMLPLMCFPATEIIDSYTVSKDQPRWKRRNIENSTRAAIVIYSSIVALGFYHNLPYVNAISGALFCCPMALIFPALFHLKLGLAKTQWELTKDYAMLGLSVAATIFTTEEVFRTWNKV